MPERESSDRNSHVSEHCMCRELRKTRKIRHEPPSRLPTKAAKKPPDEDKSKD